MEGPWPCTTKMDVSHNSLFTYCFIYYISDPYIDPDTCFCSNNCNTHAECHDIYQKELIRLSLVKKTNHSEIAGFLLIARRFFVILLFFQRIEVGTYKIILLVQELEDQRGEGAYFQKNISGNT